MKSHRFIKLQEGSGICFYTEGDLTCPKPESHPIHNTASAFDTQVGGSHYKDLPVQPTEYIIKNGLPFCEGNVVKYVTRWTLKGGLEDLKKARHYLDLLIEVEERKSES